MFRRHSTESVFVLPGLVFLIPAALVLSSFYVDVITTRRLMWIIAVGIAVINIAVFFARSGSISILNKNLYVGISETIDQKLSFYCTKILNRFGNNKEAYHQIIDLGHFCTLLLEGDLTHIESLEKRLSEKDMLDQKVKIKYVCHYAIPKSTLDKDKRGGSLEITIGNHELVTVKVW